ncbi:hypothetical protein V6N11_059975 [Hibiscus sabdariffa]|uniref:Uncharacterized protein n=2 Tax=Hibiscus sabdariffa TaxID=183260 RepID=A0ABR2BFZ3_9ROSI
MKKNSNAVVFSLLLASNFSRSPVQGVCLLKQEFLTSQLSKWIPGDSNRLADALIKLADPSVFSLCVYSDPPPEVVSFLDMNKACLKFEEWDAAPESEALASGSWEIPRPQQAAKTFTPCRIQLTPATSFTLNILH